MHGYTNFKFSSYLPVYIMTIHWLMVPSERIAVYSECNKDHEIAVCGIIQFFIALLQFVNVTAIGI